MADKTAKNPEEETVSKRRVFTGWLAKLIVFISVAWATFHIVVASGLYIPAPTKLRAVHLGFALVLCFLLAPAGKWSPKDRPSWLDWLLAALATGTMGYTVLRYESLMRMGGSYDQIDIWVGIAGLLVLVEASRRIVSPGLVVLAVLAVGYAVFGRSMPEPFTHAGYGINRLVQHLYLTGEGVFGFILGVSAEIIIVFVLFGAVLERVGIADFFYKIANSITGRTRGGPAKVAVISSALMGMVSGETSANVATTGTFTIPLMKRVGYPAYFAGAVECSASAGGQIMPPIMGATAFVIADTLGIPYIQLAIAATLPAILYFIGVFATVHFRAVRLDMKGLEADEIPSFFKSLKDIYLMLPLAGIVVMLLLDYTPTLAAFWGGIVLAIVITSFKKINRLNIEKIITIMVNATRTAMSLALACALVGIIVGVASLTGVTMTIADIIFKLTGGALLPSLIMTMIVSIILGMGLPTTAAYVLTAISAVPVLQRLGIPEIPAHLFVLYFGVMSALTPPVCTGAYTAAGLAGANPTKTGFASLRIALSGFIAPFVFVYAQDLILHSGTNWLNVIQPMLTASAGIIMLSAALEGAFFARVNFMGRILVGIASILLIIPEGMTDYIGAAILIAFLFYNYNCAKKISAGALPK